MDFKDLKHSFRRASRQRLTLSASLSKGDDILATETINISQSGVLVKTNNFSSDIFYIGEYLKLKIEGFIRNDSQKSSVHEVVFVRSESNAIAFEFV